MIHVCSLAALPEIVRTTGASHVLTVMGNVDQVQRPVSILEANHLKVSVDDITEPMEGYIRRMLWALAAEGVIPDDACDDPWGPPLPAAEREGVRRAVREARG